MEAPTETVRLLVDRGERIRELEAALAGINHAAGHAIWPQVGKEISHLQACEVAWRLTNEALGDD